MSKDVVLIERSGTELHTSIKIMDTNPFTLLFKTRGGHSNNCWYTLNIHRRQMGRTPSYSRVPAFISGSSDQLPWLKSFVNFFSHHRLDSNSFVPHFFQFIIYSSLYCFMSYSWAKKNIANKTTHTKICIYNTHKYERRSVGIPTRYGLDGLGTESGWRRRFPCRLDRHLGPQSLLYNGYLVFYGR